MSRFKRIKNTSTKKSSVSIDEKIAALNQELEKTGMLSERMTTANVYSISKHIPATDDVISPVPDGNGLVDGTWTQPVGNAFGGGTAGTFPTTFPKIWNNAGYRTPVSGIVNTDNLNGDGAALQIAKMPDNGEPFETEVSQAARDAGAVGGFMKYNAGINAGWRSGYMLGGTRDTDGGHFRAYDGQTFGGKYGITHLGVHVNPTSHPHLFRPVNYWHPFSIFNPDIDAYWPGGDQTPKYGGTVAEINGIKYAMFTAYKWIGDGGNTYISQHARPASSILIQRRGIGDINYHGPITPGGMFGLSDQGYNYLSGRAKRRTLRGGPIYRKAGSGRGITTGRGGTRTKRASIAVPLGRGGKVSSRGVRDYVRGKGVGFSPSVGKVAQKVANQLPPKPTPAEIRKTTVDEFRKNGDNLAANRFYTEDRISELESKDNLTSTEQSELEGLQAYETYINEKAPSQPQSSKENLKINNPYNYPPPPGIEIDTDSNSEAVQNDEASSTAFKNMSLKEKLEFIEKNNPTPDYKPTDVGAFFESLGGLKTAGGSFLNFLLHNAGLQNFSEENPSKVALPRNDAQTISNISNDYLRNNVDPSEWENLSKEHMDNLNALINGPNSGVPGWDKIQQEYLGKVVGQSTSPYAEGESIDAARNIINNIGRPDAFKGMISKDKNGDPYVTGLNDTYTYTDTTDAKYAIADWLINLTNKSPLNQNRVNSPYTYENENTGEISKTSNMPIRVPFLPPEGVELSILDKAKMNLGLENAGALANLLKNMNPVAQGMELIKNIFDKLKEGILNSEEESAEQEAAEESANDEAGRYPPPGQSSEYTHPDGGKVKYYNKGIRTSADGSKYMEVLIMPWIEPKAGVHDGYYGSLYHPGSYTTKIPLGGAQTRLRGMGKEVFTPEKPDPKPEESYWDKRRRARGSSYRGPKNESFIKESVKLGHFEPEELYVDIEKLRKGIMPEFPKKSPKIIDGYHQDSKIKPKEPSKDVYLKLDPKDLIRNHRLKQKEADEMMKTIDMINAHIEEHPEDLIHAQQRYPVDDPRLAELNWKMDQMLEAGEEYMDSNFKENQTLYKRATDRTKKNIKLTDPEYVQQHYDELRGTPKPKRSINKRNVSRFFKKPTKKKSSMEEIDDKIKQLDKDLLL